MRIKTFTVKMMQYDQFLLTSDKTWKDLLG